VLEESTSCSRSRVSPPPRSPNGLPLGYPSTPLPDRVKLWRSPSLTIKWRLASLRLRLKIAEERDRDASRQRRRGERSAAALAVADHWIEAQERERREEEEIQAANWVADIQLQFSQLSYEDAEADEDQQETDLYKPTSPSEQSSSPALSDNHRPRETGTGSQAQPLKLSSDSEICRISDEGDDNEPRRSGRVKKPTVVMQSQQWQIEHGLIPALGAKSKARALNTKKKIECRDFTVRNEFRLLE